MHAVYVNANFTDDERRRRLYQGDLFVYSKSPGTDALCAFARELCEEMFAPYHPQEAQYHMPVEDYVAILAKLKPTFIHHPRSKELIQGILAEYGCDLEKTYFDVPRLRTATSDGYLTAGLGYVFKAHRDTWYSTPMCQLNWWLPVYEVESDNAMAFHPKYWNTPVRNDSDTFNYQEWNRVGRQLATRLIKKDTRKQAGLREEIETVPQLRICTEPGGLLIFSAAHLHSSVPNTSGQTRISIDFRTVHLNELATKEGAPNIDSRCTGTTIHDYLCARDLSNMPGPIMSLYEDRRPALEELSPQYRLRGA